jgi:hypothetical protein
MPTLSSSLVKHQVASMEDVEEALSRQVQYGGDLVTNLLELKGVSEERLTTVVAESNGLEPAPTGELPRAADGVRRLVSGELAQRYAFYPLQEVEGQLTIAVSEPLPGEVESDMAFSLGVNVVQRWAPLIRVRQALARDYGFPLEQRMEHVLSRLGGSDLLQSVPPEHIEVNAEGLTGIRPATLAPPQPLETPVVPKLVEAAPTPELPPAIEGTPPSPQAAPPPPPLPRPAPLPNLAALARRDSTTLRSQKRLGPYTAAMAEQDLQGAETRDDVLRAFFDFIAQYFEYAALFAVHGDLAEGRDARGPGASRAKLSSIGVPLDLPSALSSARESAGPLLARLTAEGIDLSLAKDLERRPGRLVLLLPVRVRSRCVLLLYGDHGESDVTLESVGDVLSFTPLVSAAIERLIQRLKRSGTADLPAAPPRQRHVLPSAGERAQALASALENRDSSFPPSIPAPRNETLPPPGKNDAFSARLSSATLLSSLPPSFAPARDLPPEREDSTPPENANLSTLPPAPDTPAEQHDPSPSLGRHGRPSVPPVGLRQRHLSEPPTSIAEALSSPPARRSEPSFPQEFGTRPGVGGALDDRRWKAAESEPEPEPEPEPETEPDPEPEPSPPAKSVASGQHLQLVSDGDDFEGEELTDDDVDRAWGGDLDDIPSSRVESHGAVPLPRREQSSELKLPSVIVDLANDCRTLLDQVLAGDVAAEDRLVEIGTTAVTVLVGAFPGPLKHPSLRPGGEPTRASECGPILRTLLRLGHKSVPFVAVRTNDTDPVVRRWATHLLGELPSQESLHAVARRFFDTDDDVRRAALASARMFLTHPEFGRDFVGEFGRIAQDANKGTGMRQAAIDALAELRHPLCVPELIHVLPQGPAEITQAASRALSVVTRQDFGTDGAAWTEWWRANGGRHRIEWLIDALTHEAQEVRRPAGEELKALTREYFGYYDDLPPRERERAQMRYREWWETRGKARFH